MKAPTIRKIKRIVLLCVELCIFVAAIPLGHAYNDQLIGFISHSSFLNMDALAETVIPAFVAFVSIWAAGYQIRYQVYIDRFPEAAFDRRYKSFTIDLIVAIMLALVAGCYSLASGNLIMQVAFVLTALVITLVLLVQSLISRKHFAISGYAHGKIDDMINSIKDPKRVSAINSEDLKPFNDMFVESLTRKEYYACICIHEELSKLLRAQAEENTRLYLNFGNTTNHAKSCKSIIKSLLGQIGGLGNEDPSRFMGKLLQIQTENIEACIKSDQHSLCKTYFHEFQDFLKKISQQGKVTLSDKSFALLAKAMYLSLKEDKTDLFDDNLSFLTYSVQSSRITPDIILTNGSIEALALVLSNHKISKDSKHDAAFSRILKAFIHFSTLKAKNSNTMCDVSKFQVIVFRALLSHKSEDLIRDYIAFLKDTFFSLKEESAWLNCIYLFVDRIEASNNINLRKEVNDLEKYIILTLLRSKINPLTIHFPDYAKTIDANKTDKTILNDVESSFISMTHTAIQNGVAAAVDTFAEALHKTIVSFASKSHIVAKLLNVYFVTLEYAAMADEPTCFQVISKHLEQSISALDEKRMISFTLGKEIIMGTFSAVASVSNGEPEYRKSLITFAMNLADQEGGTFFLATNPKLQIEYSKEWLALGVILLENDNESALREISEHLGWHIIHALQKMDLFASKIFLDSAIELNNFARHYDLRISTQYFLLTLFVIVGYYCCTNEAFSPLLDQIITFLKQYPVEKVRFASETRFSVDSYWNDQLLDGKAEECSKRFFALLS